MALQASRFAAEVAKPSDEVMGSTSEIDRGTRAVAGIRRIEQDMRVLGD